jgi:hypothetical protein
MVAKLTRLTHRIAIKLHRVTESCTICSSRSRRPVLKLFGYTLVCYYRLIPVFFNFTELNNSIILR